MLEWLSSIINGLTAWCPRFCKVPPTFRMVKWSKCREATLHGPGLVWYWPLVTETMMVDLRWESLVTHVQTITLADGTSVSARTLTRWKVEDPVHCATQEKDYADTVGDAAQSILVDVLSPCGHDMMIQARALNVALTLAMQEELREVGVRVKKCKFTELCVSPALRIINDG